MGLETWPLQAEVGYPAGKVYPEILLIRSIPMIFEAEMPPVGSLC